MNSEPFEYVRTHYGVPAEYGRRVVVNGKPGIIVKDLGHHIGVVFDKDKPTRISPAHPTWEVEYGEIGVPRKVSKGAERYRRFLDFDGGMKFIEFCKMESLQMKRGVL